MLKGCQVDHIELDVKNNWMAGSLCSMARFRDPANHDEERPRVRNLSPRSRQTVHPEWGTRGAPS